MADLGDTVREFWKWFRGRTQASNDDAAGSALDRLISDEIFVRKACNRASFATPERVLRGIVAKYLSFRNLPGITETDAVAWLADNLVAAREFDGPTREKLRALRDILREATRERGIVIDRQALARATYRVIARYYAAVC